MGFSSQDVSQPVIGKAVGAGGTVNGGKLAWDVEALGLIPSTETQTQKAWREQMGAGHIPVIPTRDK